MLKAIKWFEDKKIQSKLFIAFGSLITILVITSAFSGFQLFNIDKKYTTLITSSIGRQSSTAKAIADLEKLYHLNMIKSHLATVGAEEGEMQRLHLDYASYVESFTENLKVYRRNMQDDINLTAAEKQDRSRILNEIFYLFTYEYSPKVMELDSFLHSDKQELYRSIGESTLIGDQITERMNQLYQKVSSTAEAISLETSARSHQTILWMFVIILTLIVIAIILSLFMTLIIKNPIERMENAMVEISNGNLTYPIRTRNRDELGMLANQIGDMVESLYKTQEELRLALLAAEDSSKAKSEFLDNMNHELRTPMNGILGFLRMARRAGSDAEVYDNIERAEQSAKNLLKLINDVLDFTEIEENKMQTTTAPFKPVQLFEELRAAFSPAARAKELDLNFRLPDDLPETVIGDVEKIKIIFSNLIDNAIKFTEKGKITVRGQINKQDGNHIELDFYVRDTGIGMTSELKGRIFTPFSLGDSSCTRKYGGAGLGLALAKHLTHLLGGRIWAESERDEGSTFHFTVMFGLPDGDEAAAAAGLADDNDAAVGLADGGGSSVAGQTDDAGSGATDQTGGVGTELNSAADQTETNIFRQTDGNASPVKKCPERGGAACLNDGGEAAQCKKCSDRAGTHVHRENASAANDGDNICRNYANIISDSSGRPYHCTRAAREDSCKPEDMRLLLADDVIVNQIIAEEMLTGMGYKVDVANNGQEALDMLALQDYCAILMDIQMPVMDGLTATKKIRELKKYCELPIIAISAHSQPSDIEKSIECGMNDHITKPIDPEIISFTLNKWLKPAV